MKYLVFITTIWILSSCNRNTKKETKTIFIDSKKDEVQIVLDSVRDPSELQYRLFKFKVINKSNKAAILFFNGVALFRLDIDSLGKYRKRFSIINGEEYCVLVGISNKTDSYYKLVKPRSTQVFYLIGCIFNSKGYDDSVSLYLDKSLLSKGKGVYSFDGDTSLFTIKEKYDTLIAPREIIINTKATVFSEHLIIPPPSKESKP